ncbi:MAG: type I glyceraldehyde-3-phosphate dehydrogenase [Acidobacteria bacterium]|nr:type I glyceraldehyde-3-phosphate dehydrogenase [Acidobacteriota bacterium]
MKTRVGINGFGRIGRCVFKQLLADHRFEVVGVNDLSDLGDLAYLLKYDSVHGWYPTKVSREGDHALIVDDQRIAVTAEPEPSALDWGRLGAEVVIEATGAFRARAQAAGHITAGARKVIISAPSDDADGMFVLGVNHDEYSDERHEVVSMASCTTNCLAPVAMVLDNAFGIEHLMITTVHAYTASQSLMDQPTRKRRRGRAAAVSIIPTTTGATQATARVLPQLTGKMDGMAMRVPIPDGSVTDIVVTLETDTTVEEVNSTLEAASRTAGLDGILRVTDEALVSRDILGDTHSSIVDAQSTLVLDKRVVKILSWYDNEWGYAARLKDFTALLAPQDR